MTMIYGFLDSRGMRVASFDGILEVRPEISRGEYNGLSKLAEENSLTLELFPLNITIPSIAFAKGNQRVYSFDPCTNVLPPITLISYLPGFFGIANRATRIITGNSLLSSIRQYSKIHQDAP